MTFHSNPSPDTKRVLAIDLTSRGFGFAVLEGPNQLIDWGVRQCQVYTSSRTLMSVRRLIEQYQPDVLVVEQVRQSAFRSSNRVFSLYDEVLRLAGEHRITTRRIPWKEVRNAFRPSGLITKHRITRIIATRLPVLEDRLPPYRKAWMSEDYRMAIFDAVALAYTFYNSLDAFSSFLSKDNA